MHRPELFNGNSSKVQPSIDPTAPSAQGPKIMDVAFWGVSGSGVSISWSSDQPADGAVVYGKTSVLDQITPVQSKLSISHGAVLSNLSGGTKYYFAAQSTDASGHAGRSKIYEFTTVVTAPPAFSGIVVAPGANHQAAISWTTSVPTNSYVQYGVTSAYGIWSKKTELTSHPRPEMGWVPSGIVHYHLVSIDSIGNQAVSSDYTFVEP